MPFVVSEQGVRTFYEVRGESGPFVVLIQGLGLSSRFWFEAPETLSDSYRVILVDNRGVGQSDRPRGIYSLPDMADDIARVLTAASCGRAMVMGISMGGMIAQHLALRHPSRVRGLALLATTAGLPFATMTPVGIARLIAAGTRKRDAKSIRHALAQVLLPKALHHQAEELLKEWPRLLQSDGASNRVFFSQLLGAMQHHAGFWLDDIGCPTLVVSGDQDVLFPLFNARQLARRIPGAELEIIPNGGHGLPLQDKTLVRRLIDRLAQTINSKTASAGEEHPPHPID